MLCTPHRFHAEQIVAAARGGQARVLREAADHHRAPRPRLAIEAVTAAGVQLGDRARATLRAGRPRAAGACCIGELGHAAGVRGQLQPGQVPRPAARQLAAVRRRGAGRSAVGDRHPPRRPGDRHLRPPGRGVGPAVHPGHAVRQRRHPHHHAGLREGPDGADHRDPHDPVRRPGHRARLARAGWRSATAATPRTRRAGTSPRCCRGAEPVTGSSRRTPPSGTTSRSSRGRPRARGDVPVHARGDAGERARRSRRSPAPRLGPDRERADDRRSSVGDASAMRDDEGSR